ncbi:MAG: hypothetical protein GY793_03255 [Proteobacteria bacterium]|nr:hypothetical protein [Pseudomonadota bacterium]
MKVKALFLGFLIIVASVSVSNAAQKEYALIFEKENHWVSPAKIQPLIDAVKYLKARPNTSLKAACSSQDSLCKQRVTIINYILNKQETGRKITLVETSHKLGKNYMVLKSIGFDKNKYSGFLINYNEGDFKPVTKSEQLIKLNLKKAEQKYLSQFNLYCKKLDPLCKTRFNYINKQLATTLTFKYNIFLKEDSDLTNNQTKLEFYRHDYSFEAVPETQKQLLAKLIKPAKKIKKVDNPKYIKNNYIISFSKDSSDLIESEKTKINKILKKSTNNKFFFACDRANPELCKRRVQEIKFHALTETQSLIELYQLKESAHPNLIVIKLK